MACCDWETFKSGFLAAWKLKCASELLIDWKCAKRDWKRYHCTSGEAASMQLRKLAKEGNYLWLEILNNGKRNGGDGDGGVVVRPMPRPLQPLPA